jgi:hypothetical protein
MEGKPGGPRPGAGRKPKADKYSADINKAEKQIRDHLPEIVAAQIALSLGLKTETEEGVIYTTIPDRAAGQYLINRIAGSPTQKQEISGSIETIKVEYVDPD